MKSQLVKYLLYVKDDEAEVLFYSTVAAEKPSWTHSCASFPGLGIHKVYLKKKTNHDPCLGYVKCHQATKFLGSV